MSYNNQTIKKKIKTAKRKGLRNIKGRSIKISPDVSPQTLKARKTCTYSMRPWRQPKLIYPESLSITIDRETRYLMKMSDLKNVYPQIQSHIRH